MFISRKCYMMSSYLLLMTFITIEMQALPHHWKNGMDRCGDYVKNIFSRTPSKYHILNFKDFGLLRPKRCIRMIIIMIIKNS